MFYKRKNFIFVKNYADEGKIARFDEKRRIEAEPACRAARDQSRRNIPHSRRTQQTGLRFAAKDPQEVSRINPDWLLLDSDKMYRDEYPAASSGQQASRTTAAQRSSPELGNDLFSRRHCRADFGRMKNKRRTPTGMTDLRRSFRRRCSAKRISNASSCSMMTRPSKVLRHRQSVEIIHAGRCPEYSILGKIKFGQPGFRFETDGTWSIPETLGNYLLIGKEKFLATVQLPVFITRFI